MQSTTVPTIITINATQAKAVQLFHNLLDNPTFGDAGYFSTSLDQDIEKLEQNVQHALYNLYELFLNFTGTNNTITHNNFSGNTQHATKSEAELKQCIVDWSSMLIDTAISSQYDKTAYPALKHLPFIDILDEIKKAFTSLD